MKRPRHVATIGAGLAALSAAARLAHAGFEVTLLEKEARVGGKATDLRRDGFRFDLGPTLLTMPWVLDELFASCGVDRQDYLELLPLDATCRYHWADGSRLTTWSDRERLLEEVAGFAPHDTAAVARYLAEMRQLYDRTRDLFLTNAISARSLRHILRPSMLPLAGRLGLGRGLWSDLERRFADGRLRQLFGRFATYNGSDPRRTPATMGIISHVELGMPVVYPRGGMGALADGLAGLVREKGGVIRTAQPVRKLVLEGKRVSRVMTTTGDVGVDALLSNADVLWTYRELLAPHGISTPRRVAKPERSLSGFLILAAVEGEHPELAHHNIFFSDDYPAEVTRLARGELPDPMTVYVSVAGRSDLESAPEGCESWYILVNAPPHQAGRARSSEEWKKYEEAVWGRLAAFGLRPRRRWEVVMTPEDFERRDNAIGGALYGGASNDMLSAFLRPPHRASNPSNLYFAGGTVHPGGGIPLVILSGGIAARSLTDALT